MSYRPKARLRDMVIDEISFVDNPAHPDAIVVLAKRNDEEREALRREFLREDDRG